MNTLGAIACGHRQTAYAAESILRQGGNAFDAVLAAHYMACVVEPVLGSLGGGGFLLAHTQHNHNIVYDFFAQTPIQAVSRANLDFFPIHADFGTTTQEFHIGLGSIATPGAVKGIFAIHKDLCSMPMREIAQPAIEAARKGVPVNSFHAYILDIVKPILLATPEAKTQYRSQILESELLKEGEILKQSHMADFMEALAIEGDDLFYNGEIAHSIYALCAHGGGQLTLQDLNQYKVIQRKPIKVQYRDVQVFTNPPPSCGGSLIAFALKLLESLPIYDLDFGGSEYLRILTTAMNLTNKARLENDLRNETANLHKLLDTELLDAYRKEILSNPHALRGTTHMSVMDKHGNIAGLTVSNGEGCGHIIPGTGIMLNNMLGEEDLNPKGFYQWQNNQRMTSMMAPTLVIDGNGTHLSLGSGGSNRLRTAILQVLLNVIDHKMDIEEAVHSARIHYENDLLSIENGYEKSEIQKLLARSPNHKLWAQKNLFFGGVHAVQCNQGEFSVAGDPRRGGAACIVA